MMSAHAPIVIVGGGIAGLVTALAATPASVQLLCRHDDANDGASVLAQGGIAAALGPDDDPEKHARDTMIAGAQHNDAAMVRWLCAHAVNAVHWLQIQGVRFDRDTDGSLQLGREGGHGHARIVHAGGDASGAEIVRTLCAEVAQGGHVLRRSEMDTEALMLRGGAVCGVRARDARGAVHEIEASAVVLATGGTGALFARTTNPPGAQGSGLALGMAAGAQTRDMEFVQFHPTALDIPGRHCLPLITEALRGAGARFRDDNGRLLMAGMHPQEDLAPRDVVARHIWRMCQCGVRVWLDAGAVQGDWTKRFPTVLAVCLAAGIDPRRTPIPVVPAAHFHMGGLAVDHHGRTSVPGLFAVGEVACNGLHGANRLASNSLLEAVVCGKRLGTLLAAERVARLRGTTRSVERGAALPEARLGALRDLLWAAAGSVREGTSLRRALRVCAPWRGDGWQARVACRLLEGALQRAQSLGAHYRSDTIGASSAMRRRMGASA
ncbi:MAG: FAD-dependent oxidoreductase [Xanthomonadaceae bacterium]|nr:FAD-dependent oxidoreductase [Xanthomonadaceae bacterium]